jgi:glycosyltransferase involved in cell wall biosynthesis
MKVGIILGHHTPITSVANVFRDTIEALKQDHELIYPSLESSFGSNARQGEALRNLISSSDVLLGVVNDPVLQARQDLGRPIPYLCFMLGTMPRGASDVMKNYHLYRTTDVLLLNCTADFEIANNFFENAQARLLPFAFRESDFYPLDEASKQALRAKLGFGADDKILLYSGRLTLEKNVHMILRLFSIIQELVPNARLIVAGQPIEMPFFEFGAYPRDIRRMLEKIIKRLGIDEDRVLLAGKKNTAELRELYSIADVLVNMTLNHDENFGLAQVEAMACGTPVVGTDWGGLKDTIADGETGYKVATALTATGVKMNWWEAVNRIVSIISKDSEGRRLRRQCQEQAHGKYSLSRYRETLNSILDECQKKLGAESEILKASEFAKQFWDSCEPVWSDIIAYKHGVSPYEMYTKLITPYVSAPQNSAGVRGRLENDQVLCLATPVTRSGESSFEIDDPIFPLKIAVPDKYKEIVDAVIGAMQEEPAIMFERLRKEYLAGRADIPAAVNWMIDAGLILKSESENNMISPRSIGKQMGTPLFSIERINYSTDIIALSADSGDYHNAAPVSSVSRMKARKQDTAKALRRK